MILKNIIYNLAIQYFCPIFAPNCMLQKGMKSYLLCLILFLSCTRLFAQEYHGTSGLLHMPSAEMGAPGTFRGLAQFLSKDFMPDKLVIKGEKYNTFNYGVGLSVFSWLEVSYCASLRKNYRNQIKTEPIGYYNEDRRFNVKVRPLKEGRWSPAIAFGMNDIGRFDLWKNKTSRKNNHFQSVYVVASKYIDVKGSILGAHVGYTYYPSNLNKNHRGVMGGLTFQPVFYQSLRLIAEWDAKNVNVGADILLWQHLFLQACLADGRSFTGGVSYHYTIPY